MVFDGASYETIRNEEEVEAFLEKYGSFDDACVTECVIKTGFSIDEMGKSRIPITNSSIVSLTVKRRGDEYRSIEFIFKKVKRMLFVPLSENQGMGQCLGARLFFKDGSAYFVESDDWDEANPERMSFIQAKELYWRPLGEASLQKVS